MVSEVPSRTNSGWTSTPLRSILQKTSVRDRPDLQLLSVLRSRGVIRRNFDKSENHNFIPDDLSNYKVVEQGDLVINKMKAWSGSVGVSRFDGIVSPAYIVCKVRGCNPSFLNLLLRSDPLMNEFARHSDGVRVGQWDLSPQALKVIRVAIPSIEDQEGIVRYLDNAELRIARAIQAKSKATKLLREARDSMINELVLGDSLSRGNSVDSGIPGIGMVPKHWRLVRAKYVWRPKNIRSKTGDEERLSVSSMSGIVPRSSKKVTMFEAVSYVGHKVVEPGDLVINSLWAWATGLGVSRHHGLVSPVYGVYELRPESESDLTYLNYLLRSNAIQWQFQVQSKGIWRSRLQLSDDAFFRIVIPLPPLSEQISIASLISSRIAGLDAAINAAEHEIILLREYRTRLIADVVTGQKDVRAEAADLPDVDPLELAQVLSGTIAIGDDVDEEVSVDAD